MIKISIRGNVNEMERGEIKRFLENDQTRTLTTVTGASIAVDDLIEGETYYIGKLSGNNALFSKKEQEKKGEIMETIKLHNTNLDLVELSKEQEQIMIKENQIILETLHHNNKEVIIDLLVDKDGNPIVAGDITPNNTKQKAIVAYCVKAVFKVDTEKEIEPYDIILHNGRPYLVFETTPNTISIINSQGGIEKSVKENMQPLKLMGVYTYPEDEEEVQKETNRKPLTAEQLANLI